MQMCVVRRAQRPAGPVVVVVVEVVGAPAP